MRINPRMGREYNFVLLLRVGEIAVQGLFGPPLNLGAEFGSKAVAQRLRYKFYRRQD